MAAAQYEKVQHQDLDGEGDMDTASEFGSGYGSEGEKAHLARTSEEVRRADFETLHAEEEAETLLSAGNAGGGEKGRGLGNFFSRRGSSGGDARVRRKQRRRKSRGRQGELEQNELMYEMEEGPRSSSSNSSAAASLSSSEVDLHKLGQARAKQHKSKGRRIGRFVLLHVVIALAFFGLIYGASKASRARPLLAYEPRTLSNGTHTFLPTTLLVSLDGFRADFLQRNMTPHLSAFMQQGVSPKYMLPSFPSLTFPNHFTLVTGLHPESHGIVGNNFWDPDMQRHFTYAQKDHSMQPEWWTAEPVWVRAEKAGVRTAIHMWPGSEANISGVELSWVDRYNGQERLENKVARIMSWLDEPGPNSASGVGVADGSDGAEKGTRPQLLAMYVPNVDVDGHRHGPNSTQMRDAITAADNMVGELLAGIDARNLTDIVNVVIVSDHGMATTDKSRLVQLEDLIDPDLVEHTDGWPSYGLRLKDESEAHLMEQYNKLLAKSQQPEFKGKFGVYTKETMPSRYHFAANARIAPLWLITTTGYGIARREEYNLMLLSSDKPAGTSMNPEDRSYTPRGAHGYDNQHPLMRAIFAARGPAFPLEGGSELAPFQNTEVYNIVCDSLGLSPQANNGSLRLPLQSVGVHSFPLPLNLPDDPGLNHEAVEGADTVADDDDDESDELSGVITQPAPASPDRPQIHDGEEAPEREHEVEAWLDWMKDKFENVKDWAVSTFGGKGKNGTEGSRGGTG